MNFPLRVVGDHHVDRQEVQGRRRPQLTCTNGPRDFPKRKISQEVAKRSDCDSGWEHPLGELFSQVIYCGGYSGEDPPLPIPNREVKLTIADGTDPPVGRVGSRRSLSPWLSRDNRGLFLFSLRSNGTTATFTPRCFAAAPEGAH